ncbi:hypothetical protein E1H18_2780 [Caulobacter sp. RHG1]|nr:hypothetical protein [Caulobacter sp. RHG1]
MWAGLCDSGNIFAGLRTLFRGSISNKTIIYCLRFGRPPPRSSALVLPM